MDSGDEPQIQSPEVSFEVLLVHILLLLHNL